MAPSAVPAAEALVKKDHIDAGVLLQLLDERLNSHQTSGTSGVVQHAQVERQLLRSKGPIVQEGALSVQTSKPQRAGGDPQKSTGWNDLELAENGEAGGNNVDTFTPLESPLNIIKVPLTDPQIVGGKTINEPGESENVLSWLDDPMLKVSLLQLQGRPAVLAFAKGKNVGLTLLSNSSLKRTDTSGPNEYCTVDSHCEANESVTALEWLCLPNTSPPTPEQLQVWLCIGTSAGHVRFFSISFLSAKMESLLVHSQRFYRGPVMRLQLRWSIAGLAASDSLQELNIVYSGGALVAVQASDLIAGLEASTTQQKGVEASSRHESLQEPASSFKRLDRKQSGEVAQVRQRKGHSAPAKSLPPPHQNSELDFQSPGVEAPSSPETEGRVATTDGVVRRSVYLPFLKWKFASGGVLSNAVIMGVRPASLLGGFVEEPSYAVVVAGAKPFLAFFDAPIREESESMLSRASGVATKVGSAVYSSASSVLSFGRALQPMVGAKLLDLRGGQTVQAPDGDTRGLVGETGGVMDIREKGKAWLTGAVPGIGVGATGKPLQDIQKAVTENLGAAAASVNSAAANLVSAGPAVFGRQLAASVSARSASLGSLHSGLGLREKLKASLGIKASGSLETARSLDSKDVGEIGSRGTEPSTGELPSMSGLSDERKAEDSQADIMAEGERLERMQGVAASLVGCLDDLPREGLGVWMAPQGALGAVADSLGRVCLFDGLGGVVLRVWKGYRDAQCAWILGGQKQALLRLAIYGPRTGILDVWAVPFGAKLATSDCGYGCRLVQGTAELKSRTAGGQEVQHTLLATPCLVRPDGGVDYLS